MTQLRRTLDRLNRSKSDSEKGFSLIELIIVIVILGILVAIAIPIYNHIQDTAKKNAVETAANNGASQAVSQIANGGSPDLSNLASGDVTVTPQPNFTSTDNVCVKATDGTNDYYAGPGAATGGGSCDDSKNDAALAAAQ
jgi:type IV pilus assembly protein PilA